MIGKFIKKIKFYYNAYFNADLYFLDKNEKIFINRLEKEHTEYNKTKKKILISLHSEYFFLIYFSLLVKEKKFKNYELIGVWTNHFLCFNSSSGVIIFICDIIKNYFIFLKWKKLYSAIGIKKFIFLQSGNPINLLISYYNSKKKLKIKNKKKLLQLKLNGLKIGDLFYDTYLRFYKRTTVDLKDKFKLHFLYCQFEMSDKKLNQILKKYHIKYLLSGFSAFLQHGLPVRFFLKKNIEVYGGKNFTQLVKKFNKANSSHLENWNSYKNKFDEMKNKQSKRILAKKLLTKRVKGITKDYFMKKSSFYIQKKYKTDLRIKKIDCIIFLPDFTDSPHIKGPMIFNDYNDWIFQTLNFLMQFNNHKIAIKPHPNSQYSGKMLIQKLKNDFKSFYWLNENCSNKSIYKKNPYFGISPAGTALIEMPFFNVIPISAGRNPFFTFSFGVHPKSIKDYFLKLSLLMNRKISNSIIKKDQIYEAYYMHYLNKNDAFKNNINNYGVYDFFKNRNNSSDPLKKFAIKF